MTASRAPLRQIAAHPVPRSIPPRPKPAPQKSKFLQRLHLIQHIAVATTLLLTGCVFCLYAWTVFTQKRWNEQYNKLEYYKQLEGRLINAAEALEHDRLQRAWQSNSLVRETPDRVVFVEGAPPRPKVEQEPVIEAPPSHLPIAY